MKRLLFIAGISLLLSLKISANITEIEQAIFDSRPKKLEELLSKATLDKQQIQDFVILAEQRYKMRSSAWGENPQPGESFAIFGGLTSIGSLFMLGIYAMFNLDPELKEANKNKPFNYPFAVTTGGLVAISSLLLYLAYKENKKPGWRSKVEEQWDAFKVLLVLSNLHEQKKEESQANVNQ